MISMGARYDFPEVCLTIDTSSFSDFSFDNVSRLVAAAEGICHTIVTMHPHNGETSPFPNTTFYTDEDIFGVIPNKKTVIRGLIPGNFDLKAIRLARDFPEYSIFLRIEYDVVVSDRDWRAAIYDLVSIVREYDFSADFIRNWNASSKWMWWNTLRYPSRENPRPLGRWAVGCFCPIMAYSRRFIDGYADMVRDGLDGHAEVTLSTYASENGLNVFNLASDPYYFTSRPQFGVGTVRDLDVRIPRFLHPVKNNETYLELLDKINSIRSST